MCWCRSRSSAHNPSISARWVPQRAAGEEHLFLPVDVRFELVLQPQPLAVDADDVVDQLAC